MATRTSSASPAELARIAELRAAIETITHPAIYEYQKYGDQGVETAIDALLELIIAQ